MTNEPETFAAVVAEMREVGKRNKGILAVYLNGFADRLVAAHEREVAELAAINIEAINEKTKAEIKISELENIVAISADESVKKDATIAELKEALRKIADKPFNAGCIAQSGDHCDAKSCQDCTYSMRNFARAALEKTEGGEK